MNQFDNTAPVSEGDELDVTIEAVGEKGDGIAKVEGFVLFVAGTKAGDEVRIRVTKVLKNVGFAERIGDASGGSGKSKKDEGPKEGIKVDEKTGREKIVGSSLEAEYDPSKDSEDFGED